MGGADGGDATFGTLLRHWRGCRGLTQAELAEKSGLSAQAISLLERGARRAPRVTTVELLADALQLHGAEGAAFHAAGRADRAPAAPAPIRGDGRLRWRLAAAAIGAMLLTGSMIVGPIAWWRSHAGAVPVATLVGARVYDWPSANRDVGPLQTQRVYHRGLPAAFAGSEESRLPPGVVPIVSYRAPTTNVLSYVRSVNRRMILIFLYNPEPSMSASEFVSEFEEQSSLVRSVRNPYVRVAMSANVYQYQTAVNASAMRCDYIPPPSAVDYYLAAVYEPYLEGLTRTDGGAFVVWQNCTSRLHRPRGLAEYGLGLGIPHSTSCQPEAERTNVMGSDLGYLHDRVPDLAILEYWWATTEKSPTCQHSWQFAAGSSTGDLWRAIANRR